MNVVLRVKHPSWKSSDRVDRLQSALETAIRQTLEDSGICDDCVFDYQAEAMDSQTCIDVQLSIEGRGAGNDLWQYAADALTELSTPVLYFRVVELAA